MFCSTVLEQIFRPQFFSTVLIYPSAGHEPEMAPRGTSKERPRGQPTNHKVPQPGKEEAANMILLDVTEEGSEGESSENESFDESLGEDFFFMRRAIRSVWW